MWIAERFLIAEGFVIYDARPQHQRRDAPADRLWPEGAPVVGADLHDVHRGDHLRAPDSILFLHPRWIRPLAAAQRDPSRTRPSDLHFSAAARQCNPHITLLCG